MPELAEVETIRRGLEPVLAGGRVAVVETAREGLRVPFPQKLREKISGLRIHKLGRRAKYLLIEFETGEILVLHLGMSGRIRILAPGSAEARQKHDHFSLSLDGGAQIVLNDPRRFGSVMFFASLPEMEAHSAFRALGPEPLPENFTGRVLHARLEGRKAAIKQALMDQRIVAGVGNIYASEALFRARISPLRSAGALDEAESRRLADGIRSVLEDAIAAGGSSLRDYRKADGSPGYFQHGFAVYDRQGLPCPGCHCDVAKTGGIAKIIQGGRATYYCERVQK